MLSPILLSPAIHSLFQHASCKCLHLRLLLAGSHSSWRICHQSPEEPRCAGYHLDNPIKFIADTPIDKSRLFELPRKHGFRLLLRSNVHSQLFRATPLPFLPGCPSVALIFAERNRTSASARSRRRQWCRCDASASLNSPSCSRVQRWEPAGGKVDRKPSSFTEEVHRAERQVY